MNRTSKLVAALIVALVVLAGCTQASDVAASDQFKHDYQECLDSATLNGLCEQARERVGDDFEGNLDEIRAEIDEEALEADDTTEPPPVPEPDGTYTSSCDYLLGDDTEYTDTGYRFVADANLHNTGNIGTVDKVKAVWFLAGGDKITEHKRVKVKAGKHKRVGFTVPVGSDEIDRIQALGYDAKMCKVKVAMVDTFGAPTE